MIFPWGPEVDVLACTVGGAGDGKEPTAVLRECVNAVRGHYGVGGDKHPTVVAAEAGAAAGEAAGAGTAGTGAGAGRVAAGAAGAAAHWTASATSALHLQSGKQGDWSGGGSVGADAPEADAAELSGRYDGHAHGDSP
jgi:hypothetical protein